MYRPGWLGKTPFPMVLVLASLFVVGCGDDDPTGPGDGGGDGNGEIATRDLSFTMGGMDPHVGQLLEIRIVGTEDGKVTHGNEMEARFILDPLPSAEYVIEVPDGVSEGRHNLDFTADLNGNGSYDPPPADHAWRISLAESGDLTPEFAHNVDFVDIESPLPGQAGDFIMNLTGMDPHVGQLFELRVMNTGTGQTVGQYRLGAIPQAGFSIMIPGIIEDGESYQVDYYADLNGSGGYSAPPSDHAWRDESTGDAGGLTIDFAHNVDFTDIGFASSGGEIAPEPLVLRDLSFTLMGMDPHVGQHLDIRIVGAEDGLRSRIILYPLPSAGFVVNVPNGVAEGAHNLDFTADLNGNGTYDPPPVDHAWRIALAENGDLTPEFAHNVNFVDIENPLPMQAGDFTMNLTGMDPHVGQLFELRVMNTGTGQTVGQYRHEAIVQANFSFVIPGIIENGENYRVDYYADLNGSGGYDAPPSDHAWREDLTGGSDGLTIDFAHNVNFTDIDFVSSGGVIEEDPGVTFTQIQNEILTPSCVNAFCHPGGGAPMSLAPGAAWGNLVDVASGWGMDRVEPGDADNSALYLKVIGTSIGSRMPLGRPAISSDQAEMIRAWIEAGALDN